MTSSDNLMTLDRAKLNAALAGWMVDDAEQGVFGTDLDFRIVVWNRWMEIHSGRTADDVLGRSLFELYPDIRERGIDQYYEAAVAGRVTVLSNLLHHFVISLPATNRELGFREMPQSGRIGPVCGNGEIIGTLTSIDDVSDRLATEAELHKQIAAQNLARATAEQALRIKDDFLSTLSHEIRTPLNAVLGWARILLSHSNDIAPEQRHRAVLVIERNASAQAKIIDDMLDMARIAAGKLRLEMQPVDLMSVVLASVDVVMPSASAKRITVRKTLDSRTLHVLGDQDRLQQVVWNLLSNALKFTDAGGVIDVRLETAGKMARIVVSDSGSGITPDFLPHVFERFRQHDGSSARRYGGLGLGLALVRDLVDLHGGSVRAESDGDGKGATFTIELPTMASPELRRSERDAHRPDDKGDLPSLVGVRVLLVEDEADARELAYIALAHSGAEVETAASSSEALASMQSGRPLPDVLVSDIGMPKQDGYELMRRIRSFTPDRGGRLPGVAVTGYANQDDINRVLAAGYQVHLAKPIDPDTLVAAIAKLVSRGAPASK